MRNFTFASVEHVLKDCLVSLLTDVVSVVAYPLQSLIQTALRASMKCSFDVVSIVNVFNSLMPTVAIWLQL